MCFYNDADWYASVCDKEEGPASKSTRCDECGRPIAAGEWSLHIYQQEHEECQVCSEWGDHYDESVIKDQCKHDYGEVFDYDRCQSCHEILAAIEDVEIKEGCPPHARRPMLCELRDVFCEHSSAPLYAARAIEMFPQLANVEWLTKALVST